MERVSAADTISTTGTAGTDDVGRVAFTLLVLDQASRVLRALDQAAVPVLILKGLAYLSTFRPLTTGRVTSDVDILVRPVDRARAEAALCSAGFQRAPPPDRALHLVERLPGQAVFTRCVAGALVQVDLHWTLLDLDPRPLGYSVDHEQLWSRSVPMILCGLPVRRLCDEDLVLHSCLHHAVHEVGRSRRDLLDIQAVITATALDWTALVRRARAWGVAAPVWWALSRAQRLDGAMVPPDVLTALRPHLLFRLCLPVVEGRAQLPTEDRLMTEQELLRGLQARTARHAISSLLRPAWPSDAWLAARYRMPGPVWVRRLRHLARLAWHAGREAAQMISRSTLQLRSGWAEPFHGTRMKPVRTLLLLPAAERDLVIRAAVLLSLVRLGLWLLPFRTLQRMAASTAEWPGRSQHIGPGAVGPDRIGWAVAAVGRYVPRATCLARAIAGEVLLVRHGFPAHLRIGVARSAEKRIEAHAWVESRGEVVVGGRADLARYAVLPPFKAVRA